MLVSKKILLHVWGRLKIIKDGWETEAIPKISDRNIRKIGFFNKFFGSS